MKSRKNYIDLFSKELFPEKDSWMKNKNDPKVKIIDSSVDIIISANECSNYDKIIFHNTKDASEETIINIKKIKSDLSKLEKSPEILLVLERKS